MEKTNLCEFSFVQYKHIFNRILTGYHKKEEIIENIADFWVFVTKYENTLKTGGRPILPAPIKVNKERDRTEFHKRLLTFVDLDIDKCRIIKDILDSERKPKHLGYKVEQFLEIVLLYLDFQQKEKFQKLLKLRKTQKSLPVFEFKDNIINRIKNHQVIILAGDTGCGKSTQIPQFLHEMGYKNIACSQPRRLACISLYKRVAYEMLDNYGSKVGYQIRFERNKFRGTEICFITEGLLLRQLAVESNLFNYDALLLDEIHERNLHGDILLGLVKCLLRAQPHLKVILMSATINVELFTNYFHEEDVSYIEVPGKLYPIKIHYAAPQLSELKRATVKSINANRLDPKPYVQILLLIDNKYAKNDKGDLLIFVSGVGEINIVIDAIKEYNDTCNNWIILPLHSGLSLIEQDKVFDYAPDGLRKCIVSTNISETSLTIDGIRFVIDSGKVKEMIFDSSHNFQKLKEVWVSKSSAEQRKGRAGRTGPGICYRMYSQKDYDTFEAYPVPEIHRVPLESILLQMMAMGLPNVRIFPFIESPTIENVERAIEILKQHDALTPEEKLTSLGKALSALPVEISIGKMLLMSCVFRELNRALTFAAILSIPTPFTTRAFSDPKCERARSSFESDQGDPFTTINLFREWLEMKWNKKENTMKWCHTMGIEEQRFYELTKIRSQFENILESYNVINTKYNELKTATERSIRNGEIRMLKAMKRSQKMETQNKKKILKLDTEYYDTMENCDVREVDFRLKTDFNQLRVLIKSTCAVKHRDVLMLKLIIVSGLYPNIAIPDELNFCQAENQQFFHTFSKQYISLHPNSCFGKSWDKLRLTEAHIAEKPMYYTSRLQLSTNHQILCFQNLLETTKPYLLNTIRMPAAPSLLLFSFAIDTDRLVTRIVCDSWLCLEFPTPGSGQEVLLKSIKLRRIWQTMIGNKLTGISDFSDAEKNNDKKYDKDQLLEELIDFMNVNVVYSIKRLLPADIKNLYTYEEGDPTNFIPNPFCNDFKVEVNSEKGGLKVTENIVYGCLREVSWIAAMEEHVKEFHWQCSVCGQKISQLGISRICHFNSCRKKFEDERLNETSSKSIGSNNLKKFACSLCSKNLFLNSVDILKHKKKCGERCK